MNSSEYVTQAVAVSGVPKPAPPAILNGLPVEIWLIIFRHVISSFPARARLSVLFNIISVCHHWTNMAVNAASLWTSIVIQVSAPVPVLALNRSLLALTKGCTIDVTIVLPDSASAPFTSDHQNVLVELLSPHLHHMRSLALSGPHWPFHVAVMDMFCGVVLPMLESFAINALGEATFAGIAYDYDGRLPMLASPFGDITAANAHAAQAWARRQFPRLKSVVVSGAPYTWADFSLGDLEWLKITHQPLHCRPTHRVLQRILAASKDTLQEFEAVDCLDHPLYDASVTPVVLSALQMLTLGYSDPGEVETFLTNGATEQHPPIDNLLRRLMDRLPISKLRALSCVNVSFIPDKLDMFSAADVACGLVPENEMTVLLQSGKAFLYYMNYMDTHFAYPTGAQIIPLEYGSHVLALMERRVVPGVFGHDGQYYGPLLYALDITVPVSALCVEDVERVQRLSWMCPALRIITPQDRFVENALSMDIDAEVVSDVEMMDYF
ncbi:hypothetical protein BDZ89DRAFT_1142395 [Hymenopellis radicata]|nr:hypothetical protein BDZ89DRAFT_1142395 [Hymenopellis radicata]